jgi:Chaperone of endosialidase
MFSNLFDHLYRWLTVYMGRAGLILYGKDSPDPVQPDPDLTRAQTEQLGIQSDIAERMVGISEELLPYQIQQMEQGIRSAETAYADSREDRAYTMDRRGKLTGLQDQIIGDANTYDSAAMQEQRAAQGVADTETMIAGSEAAAARDLARRGVNPASGAALAQGNASSLAKAGIKVGAANAGRTQARAEGYMLADRATNVLAGYPSMSMSATQNGVFNGMAGLTAANQAVGGIQSGFGAASGASAGAASTASGLYGQQMSAYNTAMNNQAATNNANTQAAGTAIGAGISAYAMYAGLAASDRSLKTNIVKVSDDPRGFGWYIFDYVGGARGQYGVMAQEVAAVLPEAVGYKNGFLAVNYSQL